MPTSPRGFLQIFVCLGLVVSDPWLLITQRDSVGAPVEAQPHKGATRGGGKATPAQMKGSLERGLAALVENDYVTASRLFTESFRQSPRPELLYHLGRVAVAQGQTLVAYDLFRRYLADPSREPDEAATQLAEKAIANSPPQSGSIAVQSDPGGLVFVDDRIVGTLPLPLPVLLSPGPHTVVIEFPGRKFEAPVAVQAARVSELRISRGSGAVLLSVLPAILVASTQPSLPPEATRRLNDALEQSARVEQHTLLGMDMLLTSPTEREACLQSEACPLDLARKNKLSWVLQQRIVPAGDAQKPSWKVSLRLVHVELSEPAAVAELTCPASKLDVAVSLVKEAMGKLLGAGLNRPRGTLQVSATPGQAKLRLGSGEALPLPYTGSLWAGSYDLRIVMPGFTTYRRSVTISDEKPAEVRVDLAAEVIGNAKVSAPVRGPKVRGPRPALRVALGGTLVGLGLGMAVVGGLGLAKNGQCTSEPEVEGGNCPFLYKTSPYGGFALGSGILLLGSGVLLMALPGPSVEGPRP